MKIKCVEVFFVPEITTIADCINKSIVLKNFNGEYIFTVSFNTIYNERLVTFYPRVHYKIKLYTYDS